MFKAYVCDPEKNKGCRKTGCQTDCFLTLNPEYAKALRAMKNKEMLKYIKHRLNERNQELECGKEWDGHTEEDVNRLLSLEQQPCDDCISRADALKAIEEQKKGFYGVERYAIDECHSAVMKLPSVRPYREIVEDKRACEKCIHYVTRDSRGVVLCGCDSWECDFEEVKT